MNHYEYWALCDQHEAERFSQRARYYHELGPGYWQEAAWWQGKAALAHFRARRNMETAARV